MISEILLNFSSEQFSDKSVKKLTFSVVKVSGFSGLHFVSDHIGS